MQRDGVRFAVIVAMVLSAVATGIAQRFGPYYLFRPTYGVVQQPVPESTSTIRHGLD